MAILSDEDRDHLKSEFSEKLKRGVRLLFFTQERECMFCKETGQLLGELSELSDRIEVRTYDFVKDDDMVRKYGIDKIPAIAVLNAGGLDYGIRFYGIPSGYEASSLLEDIFDVDAGKAELHDSVMEMLPGLKEPLHIQVFVTPTCPYCPPAVRLAHKMAIMSDNVRADMVEATEFPHITHKYGVMGVPKTVINETVQLEGAYPEKKFAKKFLSQFVE
jgi:glutaredoxin-like protein